MKNTFLVRLGHYVLALAVAFGAISAIAAAGESPATLADVESMAQDHNKLALAQVYAALWEKNHPGDPEQAAKGNALAVKLYLKGDKPRLAAAPLLALRRCDPSGQYVSKRDQEALASAVRAVQSAPVAASSR